MALLNNRGKVYLGDILVSGLPTLTNPASASDLVKNKELIDADGNLIIGTQEDPLETGAPFTYSVKPISGAAYGFEINEYGYYESQNKGVDSSYAICRVHLNVETVCNITFNVINYAESNYDYAIFGNLNTALSLSNNTDSSVKESFYGRQSSSVVNVVYSNVPTGTHFIDIKFRKDGSVNNNNDSVQFKVQYNYSFPQTTIDKILASNAGLIEEHVKSGVDFLGLTGSYEGFELPALTNAGTASDLIQDKQLIGADGSVVTGSIAKKTSSDLSVSGATVTVPSGYYASQATKSVSTATQATPSISVNSSGLITASATQSEGYVSAGTKSSTSQLSTRGAQTITPSTTTQEIPSGIYLTGKQTISAIQTETKTVTTNGTYTPSSGKYFSSFTVNVPDSVNIVNVNCVSVASFTIYDSYINKKTWSYATSVSKSTSGTISLNNPSSVTLSGLSSCSTLKGKYIKSSSDSTIYYISENAQFSESTTNMGSQYAPINRTTVTTANAYTVGAIV